MVNPKTLDQNSQFEALAHKLGMQQVQTIIFAELPKHLAKQIDYPFARKHLLVPIAESDEKITVTLFDPLNLNALEEARLLLDKEVEAVFAKRELILQAIDIFYHRQEGEVSDFLATLDKEKGSGNQEQIYDLLEVKDEAPIVQLLNMVLSEAIDQKASDIHFEPFEDDLNIRYRIDGVLQTRHTPPREHQAKLLTRIKVLAKLDIAEHRLPQDGRIKLKMGKREIDFRVSTVPVTHGERIVLRILDKGNLSLGLDQIGLMPTVLQEYKQIISSTEGIILVTGPTGSGKTTTLYSTLWELYNEEINIMTIEDPVEYKLKGIAQIAVQPKIGLPFAAGLRHILRQDPDVVMIGEIRDNETAEIAIQASLTGHLVFSTLHTNDAPSTIARLMDMGIEPYLLSATIMGVLSQRLVRRICPHCKQGYKPKKAELEQLGLKFSELENKQLYHGKGCAKCFGLGYSGRCGVYELMIINDQLRSQIAQKADVNILRKIALQENMISLRSHGIELVRTGTTTLSELLRIRKKGEES